MKLKNKKLKIALVIMIILIIFLVIKYGRLIIIKINLNSEIKDKYGEVFKIVYYKSLSISDLEKQRAENGGSYIVDSGYSGFYVASEKEKIVFQIWNYNETPAINLESYTTNIETEELEVAKKIISKLGDNADYYYIQHISLITSSPDYKIDSPYYSFQFVPLSESDIRKGEFDNNYKNTISGKIGTDFENISVY